MQRAVVKQRVKVEKKVPDWRWGERLGDSQDWGMISTEKKNWTEVK